MLKHSPKKLMAALKLQQALAGLRYRLHGRRALPEGVRGGHIPQDDGFKHLSFTFAVIALSARVACADGMLTRDKYLAFRESFPLKGHLCGRIRSLFTLACEDPVPVERYALQIKDAFPERPELFISITERLFAIAAADGKISHEEEYLLAAIAHVLDVSPANYARMLVRYGHPAPAHTVLGIGRRATSGMVKRRYRELMRLYHPDRFAGVPLSPDIETLLKLKASEINKAYRRLSKRAA